MKRAHNIEKKEQIIMKRANYNEKKEQIIMKRANYNEKKEHGKQRSLTWKASFSAL